MILFGLVLPRDNDDCSVVVGGCWGWHSDDIVNLFGWGACGHLEDVADLPSGASILFVVLRLFFAAGVMTLLICLGSHDTVGCCEFVDLSHVFVLGLLFGSPRRSVQARGVFVRRLLGLHVARDRDSAMAHRVRW